MTHSAQSTLGGLKPSTQDNSQASAIWRLDFGLLVGSVLQDLGAAEQHMLLVPGNIQPLCWVELWLLRVGGSLLLLFDRSLNGHLPLGSGLASQHCLLHDAGPR